MSRCDLLDASSIFGFVVGFWLFLYFVVRPLAEVCR